MNRFLANDRFIQIMNSKNLKASNIVELTGWNATKVTRIMNKQRELTGSEIQILSEVLNIPESDFFKEGYIVVPNTNETVMADLLVCAGELFASENRGDFKGAKVGELIRKKIPQTLIQKTNIDVRDYKIEGSIGQSQYAEVPWISIFDKSITESATKGIYIVFLYSVDGKSVYLSLNQGYTYFRKKFSAKDARNEIIKMANVLRGYINTDNSRFVETIDLGAQNDLGRGYEAGHIIGMKYEFDKMPSDIEIVRDIFDLTAIYKDIKTLFAGRDVDSFYDFLVAEGRGLINLKTVEEEVNTSNVVVEEETSIDDKPKEKQDAVIDDKGTRRFPRDPKVAAKALAQGKYLCTYNKDHFTFKANGSENMYVEAHHLIPISESDRFVTSIDVEANVVSLCSVCHDCVHHGTDAEKYKIIKKLYEDRKERLENAGIYTNLEQLLSFYGIDKEKANEIKEKNLIEDSTYVKKAVIDDQKESSRINSDEISGNVNIKASVENLDENYKYKKDREGTLAKVPRSEFEKLIICEIKRIYKGLEDVRNSSSEKSKRSQFYTDLINRNLKTLKFVEDNEIKNVSHINNIVSGLYKQKQQINKTLEEGRKQLDTAKYGLFLISKYEEIKKRIATYKDNKTYLENDLEIDQKAMLESEIKLKELKLYNPEDQQKFKALYDTWNLKFNDLQEQMISIDIELREYDECIFDLKHIDKDNNYKSEFEQYAAIEESEDIDRTL